MNVSNGIVVEVSGHIWLHGLSLESARKINTLYGWPIKGFSQKIHLSDGDLLIAYNERSKRRPYSRGLYTIADNAIFMILSFVLSIFFFDEKMQVKGTLGYVIGSFLFFATLYLLSNIVNLVRAKKLLTSQSGWSGNSEVISEKQKQNFDGREKLHDSAYFHELLSYKMKNIIAISFACLFLVLILVFSTDFKRSVKREKAYANATSASTRIERLDSINYELNHYALKVHRFPRD